MPKREYKQNMNKLKITWTPAVSLERDFARLDQAQMQAYCGW